MNLIIPFLLAVALTVTGCAGSKPAQPSIAERTSQTKAAQSSYATATPASGTKLLGLDASNVTKNYLLSAVKSFMFGSGGIGDAIPYADAGSCSNGSYLTESTCTSGGGTWTPALGVPFKIAQSSLVDAASTPAEMGLPSGNGQVRTMNTDGTWGSWVTPGSGSVSDTAYGSGWNGDTTTAPSKNAVYDKIESISVGSPVTSAPTYSDAACITGQYAFGTTPPMYWCKATNTWDYQVVSGTSLVWANWSNPQPVTPTLTSIVIGIDGTTLTLIGPASLSVGAGGNGGFDVDCSTAGSNITATYSSGAPGTDLVYTLGTTVNSGDTCDLDYTQPGNGIEATTGGADLASITSASVTNNSTQSSGISDNFNRADGAIGANYTAINGSLTISSGAAIGTAWADKWMYHNTSTGSNDHYVQADVVPSSVAAGMGSGVIVRSNGTTGYMVMLRSGTPGVIQLYPFNGATTGIHIGADISTNITNATHTVKLAVSGTTFEVFVDGVSKGTWTDSTYTTGQYIGMAIRRGSDNTNFTIDNLSGGL